MRQLHIGQTNPVDGFVPLVVVRQERPAGVLANANLEMAVIGRHTLDDVDHVRTASLEKECFQSRQANGFERILLNDQRIETKGLESARPKQTHSPVFGATATDAGEGGGLVDLLVLVAHTSLPVPKLERFDPGHSREEPREDAMDRGGRSIARSS